MRLGKPISGRLLLLFLLSLLTGIAVMYLLGSGTVDGTPDIVFITIAAANKNHFPCYGYQHNTTPHICSLADEGIRFTNALSTSSEDPQTLTAIHTGKYAYDLGLVHNEMEDIPSDNFTTLARELDSAYETYLYKFGAAYGTGEYQTFNLMWKQENDFQTSELIGAAERPAIIQRLGQQMEQHPVYARLHVMDIHSVSEVSDNERVYKGSSYDGRLKYVDDYLGMLLNELKRRDLYDDALIVIAGNYGENTGEREGHSVLYPDNVRVPLIIKPPGHTIPQTQQKLVSLRDLKPTILTLLPNHDPADREHNMLSDDYRIEYVPMFIASRIIGDSRKAWLGVGNQNLMITLTANGTMTYRFNNTSAQEERMVERLIQLRDHIIRLSQTEGYRFPTVVRLQLQQIQSIDLKRNK